MRVSREQAAENRRRIVDVAARLFRERGIATTGVDAVMNTAGLTHGGFYSHFESKDKLAAEACSLSLARSLEKWSAHAGKKDPIKAIVSHYLSERHRDSPGDGCLIAALLTEASRSTPEVRQAITKGIKSLVGVLESNVSGQDKKARRANAVNLFTSLIGALTVARAVDDPVLSTEILSAASKALGTKYRPDDSSPE